jgi:hypothetical protein
VGCLYLVILGSLASTLYMYLVPIAGMRAALFVLVPISLTVTFILASIYTKYIDDVSIKLSKLFGDWVTAKHGQSPKKSMTDLPPPEKLPTPLPGLANSVTQD